MLTQTILTLICLFLLSAPATSQSPFGSGPSSGSQRPDLAALSQINRSLLLSPTPGDYFKLYQVACEGNATSRPLSKQELIKRYESSDNVRLKQEVAKYRIYEECRNEPTAWRFRYIDESGAVSIRDRSIDERSANVMYLVRSVKAFSIDMFSYDWEDPAKDAANMDRVAGPKFDNDLCGRQINQMLAFADDLRDRTSLLRQNFSSSDSTSVELTDQHISLAKILDSYGRYESGRLFGKIFSPGSYYQCNWSKMVLNQREHLKMRYCWAHLSYEKHLAQSLLERKRSRFEHPINVLYSGVCLPESCHSKSFPRHKDALQQLVNSQFKMPQSTYIDEHMEMVSLYCIPDKESEFGVPLAGKCLLAFIVGWCLLTFSVTIWNAAKGKTALSLRERRASMTTAERRSVWRSLDLLESWKDFVSCYSSPSKSRCVQLDAINFFKVFGCAFVVLGHTMALYGGYAMDEIRLAKLIENDATLCLIVAGTLVVDTFFVITGILWAYFALKRLNNNTGWMKRSNVGHLQPNLAAMRQTIHFETTQSKDERHKFDTDAECAQADGAPSDTANQQVVTVITVESWPATIKNFCLRWISFTGFRYLRIVPLYVLVHWFKKYVFIYSGTGPYWDHGFNYKTMSGACIKETFLTPFTFLAAYYPISRQCTLQSWSIANDMFFSILAPPIILLINKRPRVAFFLSLISCAVSYGFALDKMATLPSHLDELLRELRSIGFYRFFDEVSILYTAPHYRIFNFLIGVWGGYALYYKQESIEKRLALQQQKGPVHQSEQAQLADSSDQIKVEISTQPSGRKPVSDRIHWPFWFRFYATILSFGYMTTILFCFGLNETFKQNSFGLYRLIYPQFVTSIRVAWALSNVVLFMRMMTDWKDTLLMRWSASKFWQIFSRLNYAILLIHLDLLIYSMNISPSLPTSFSKWMFLNLGSGIFMLCLPMSMFIYVVFENTFDKLVRSRLPGY